MAEDLYVLHLARCKIQLCASQLTCPPAAPGPPPRPVHVAVLCGAAGHARGPSLAMFGTAHLCGWLVAVPTLSK